MMPFHICEDRQRAFDEVYEGVGRWHNEYSVATLAKPGSHHAPDVKKLTHKMVERGGAIVGTPDDAVEAIAHLAEISGGFGTLVGFMHDWAPQDAMLRSYDLFARYVVPRVQGLLRPVETSRDLLQRDNATLMEGATQGVLKAIREHNANHPRS